MNTWIIEYQNIQYGKCAVLKIVLEYDDIHCHHKVPKYLGGTDKYDNLIILHKDIHKLIHAKDKNTISYYVEKFDLNKNQIEKVNSLRKQAGLQPI